MKKVLLVEDTPSWQEALSALVEASGDYHIVAVVDNYDAALQAYEQYQPDITLLDFQINGPKTGAEVGYALILRGCSADRLLLVSSANPQDIGQHPFSLLPKRQAHQDLALRLDEMMLSAGSVLSEA